MDKKTLRELEVEAANGFRAAYQALAEIKARNLYPGTWKQYLATTWSRTESWFRQVRASATTARYILAGYGITLGNESAARDIRKVMARQVTEDILPRILARAQKIAGAGNPVQGKHIKAVIQVCCTVLDTGGYVWSGDEMQAFDAAITGEVQEAVKRQLEYVAAHNKANGWHTLSRFFWSGADNIPFPDEIQALPIGTTIEFKWRVVNEDKTA